MFNLHHSCKGPMLGLCLTFVLLVSLIGSMTWLGTRTSVAPQPNPASRANRSGSAQEADDSDLFEPSHSSTTGASEASKARVSENYGKLPLSFEVNQGQTDGQVKFLSRGNGYSLFLTSTE